MADEKKNVVATVKEKAAGLTQYNEKDLAKLKKKVDALHQDWYIHDLAYRLLNDPQNEEILKEVSGLDAKSGKAIKRILDAKKIRLAVIGGSIVVIGAVAVAATKGSKKSTPEAIDVEATEVESDEDEAYEDVDEENLEEDSDEESTEE